MSDSVTKIFDWITSNPQKIDLSQDVRTVFEVYAANQAVPLTLDRQEFDELEKRLIDTLDIKGISVEPGIARVDKPARDVQDMIKGTGVVGRLDDFDD